MSTKARCLFLRRLVLMLGWLDCRKLFFFFAVHFVDSSVVFVGKERCWMHHLGLEGMTELSFTRPLIAAWRSATPIQKWIADTIWKEGPKNISSELLLNTWLTNGSLENILKDWWHLSIIQYEKASLLSFRLYLLCSDFKKSILFFFHQDRKLEWIDD